MASIRDRITRKSVLIVLGVLLGAFLLIQLVPYRVSNPSTDKQPPWDSARTETLARAACFDCHSNETNTYWWEDIAPVSWWINNHVEEGRDALNFSECTGSGGEADDAAETVRDGSMPPGYYTWFGLHSSADLTKQERRDLAAGLLKTLRGAGCGGGD